MSQEAYIVCGNRSADLDSLASSYVKSCLISMETKNETKAKALFQISRVKWPLRREANYLFTHFNLPMDNVLFLEDSTFSAEDKIKIVLTDHHYPEEVLAPFRENIVEIIDHHIPENPILLPVKNTIANTGSCSTLVAEQLLTLLEKQPDLKNNYFLQKLAAILYCAIRIDTDHLTDQNQYDLQRDKIIKEKLLRLIPVEEVIIEKIKSLKNDLSGLSPIDLLHRDCKIWNENHTRYAICSLSIDHFNFFGTFGSTKNDLEIFLKEMNLEILFLMHFYNEPILKRELTVFFSNGFSCKEDLISSLDGSPVFERGEATESVKCDVYFYGQKNPHYSRKKIQPVLHKLINATESLI